MKMGKGLIFVVAFMVLLISSPAIAKKKPVAKEPVPCAALATDPANGLAGNPVVKFATSAIVTSGSLTYCQVDITYGTEPLQNINIRVGLPLNSLDGGTGGSVEGAWNGRTQGIGGGGCSGSTNVTGPVSAGYVGSGNDTGHSGGDCTPGVNPDGTYNYLFINDFIRNGIKEQVLFMKSVATTYYGMKPLYNYWNGCSTGGRQGYLLAQELGKGLDGILANAPAIYWTRFQTAQMWGQVVMNNLVGGPIDPAKLDQATASAVAACHGVIDTVIDDPRTCTFSATENICFKPNAPADPSLCLTPAEADAIDLIWAGPHNKYGEKIWFGLDRGSSMCTSIVLPPPIGTIYFGLNCPTPFSLGVTQLQWDTHDLAFDYKDMTIDDYAIVAQEGSRNIADLTDTFGNLDTFRRSGGKMITYVGANDQLIMPGGVIYYYRQMASRYDYRRDHGFGGGPFIGHGNDIDFTGVQKFYRLFRAPGAGHCGVSGTGPFDALVDWVENGHAPDKIDGTVGARNLRMCPYPQTAIYDEQCGDTNNPDCYYCGGNLETTPTVCEDVLVKYKHEVKGLLDYTGTGVNPFECSHIDHDKGQCR
jgi:hypothetical protein